MSPAIIIKEVEFDAVTSKKIILTVMNAEDTKITVEKVSVNGVASETDVKIDPQQSQKIEQAYEWKSKTEYKIKIATTTGLTAEITASSPKEK